MPLKINWIYLYITYEITATVNEIRRYDGSYTLDVNTASACKSTLSG